MSPPIYDQIGKNYDDTRKADSEIVRHLVSLLKSTDPRPILDLACGSGNYTAALADGGLRMVGIDQSEKMLGQARAKSKKVDWKLADAEHLSFADHFFSGALCTFAVYLFKELKPIFSEVARVVDNGPFVLFTFLPEQVRGYWLKHYFPKTMENFASSMPSFKKIADTLFEAGFTKVERRNYLVPKTVEDRFLYSGKHHPEWYLNDSFRSGISAFVLFGDEEEIKRGAEGLQRDLTTGAVHEVISKASELHGDATFIVGRKR